MNNRKQQSRILVIAILSLMLVFSSESLSFAYSSSSNQNEDIKATAFNAVAPSVKGRNKENSKLADFGWSGGSGRLSYIRCKDIEINENGALATIEFGSENYDKVKVEGKTYSRTNAKGNSVFKFPVKLNANTELSGRTTAMSQAHWIDYSIYVAVKSENSKVATSTTVKTDSLNKKCPEIRGLKKGKKGEAGDLYRIFEYEDGINLIQIDMDKKSILNYEGNDQNLYHKKIVNYLVVPEEVELPAGLDKEMIIIKKPVKNPFEGKDIDYTSLVKDKVDLVILPKSAVKGFFFNKTKKIEKLEEIEGSCQTLGIPVIVDRVQEEELYKVLGVDK